MPDRQEVHGAGKPGVDFIETPSHNETMIAALLDERRGYAQARAEGAELRYGVSVEAMLGKIDEQLRALGGEVPRDETSVVGADFEAGETVGEVRRSGRRGVTP